MSANKVFFDIENTQPSDGSGHGDPGNGGGSGGGN